MKHELKQMMYRDLRACYHNIATCSSANRNYLNRKMLIGIVAEQPAPRFYIHANQAEKYVLGYYHGAPHVLRHKDQDMILDLVENYERLRHKHPYAPQALIWEWVVESPAKRFYLVPSVMEAIIFNHWKYREKK